MRDSNKAKSDYPHNPAAYVTGDSGVLTPRLPHLLKNGVGLFTGKQIEEMEKAKGRTLHIDNIHTQINFLQHGILTIVEAAFADKEQRQAVKDLVKGEFNKRHNWLDEIVYGSRLSGGDEKFDADPQSVIEGEKKQPINS